MSLEVLKGDIVIGCPGYCRMPKGMKPKVDRVKAKGEDDF